MIVDVAADQDHRRVIVLVDDGDAERLKHGIDLGFIAGYKSPASLRLELFRKLLQPFGSVDSRIVAVGSGCVSVLAAGVSTFVRRKSIPHFGHRPFFDDFTSGCIGHEYTVFACVFELPAWRVCAVALVAAKTQVAISNKARCFTRGRVKSRVDIALILVPVPLLDRREIIEDDFSGGV